MALNTGFVSIHGRRMGMTSSGGVVIVPTSSTGLTSHLAEISSAAVFNSSITSFRSTIGEIEVAALKSVVETISSSAATVSNEGISRISSDVINGSVLKLSAPEDMLNKEIWFDSSASTITIDTTAATIVFDTSLGSSSSALVMGRAGGTRGAYVKLLGIGTTRWAVLYRTAIA